MTIKAKTDKGIYLYYDYKNIIHFLSKEEKGELLELLLEENLKEPELIENENVKNIYTYIFNRVIEYKKKSLQGKKDIAKRYNNLNTSTPNRSPNRSPNRDLQDTYEIPNRSPNTNNNNNNNNINNNKEKEKIDKNKILNKEEIRFYFNKWKEKEKYTFDIDKFVSYYIDGIPYKNLYYTFSVWNNNKKKEYKDGDEYNFTQEEVDEILKEIEEIKRKNGVKNE